MASEGYHEPVERLDEAVIDRHRAIQSIMEELEAVDWYDQRVAATNDASLAEVLGHSRDEEKEHAAMTIEWLRRHDAEFDKQLRTYLFTEGSIVGIEDEVMGGDDGGAGASRSSTPSGLGIGSLKSTSSSIGDLS